MWRLAALALLLFGPSDRAPVLAQAREEGSTKVNHDPEAARLVTSDIDHFWKAFDAAKHGDRAEVFDREYFGKGSDGLKAFKRLRIDRCGLIETLATHPRYYASIRESTLSMKSMEGAIRASFRKLSPVSSASKAGTPNLSGTLPALFTGAFAVVRSNCLCDL